MTIKNAFYAQSGGVTAVINATACGVIQAARKQSDKIGTVFAGRNGILGALREELIDTAQYTNEEIAALKHTPSGAFGSCRYKLKSIEESREQYERLIEVFKAHDIGYFFYNGGNDSQDTAYKISQLSETMGYPITCVGIPKTVDNDLPVTDFCPGFGSVAKYVAVSIQEASMDIESMCESSTKVFIMEVMGRHAGWIAAAGALAQQEEGDAPHIILFPEIEFDQEKFLAKVKSSVETFGYCSIVASEGTHTGDGFLSASSTVDAFGHAQLGGVAPVLAHLIKRELGYKYHWALADYLQRSARHIASKTDVDLAYKAGEKAIEYALAGMNAVMPAIQRSDSGWHFIPAPLKDIANVERFMPREFISEDGFGITQAAREYLLPLIQGEDFPPFVNGIPNYVRLKHRLTEKKLQTIEV